MSNFKRVDSLCIEFEDGSPIKSDLYNRRNSRSLTFGNLRRRKDLWFSSLAKRALRIFEELNSCEAFTLLHVHMYVLYRSSWWFTNDRRWRHPLGDFSISIYEIISDSAYFILNEIVQYTVESLPNIIIYLFIVMGKILPKCNNER